MSNDSNYIEPKHNAFVGNEIPVALYDKYREAIRQNLSNKFIELFIEALQSDSSMEAKHAINTLLEDVGAYLENNEKDNTQ